MATGTNDGFYSSTQSALASAESTKLASSAQEPEQEKAMNWLAWVVELQNKMTVWWQKRELEERQAFKEQEEAKWAARKKETHRQVHLHDGIAKAEMARIRQERQEQGNAMKNELKEMEEVIKSSKEEWMAHGLLLQEKHGYEQSKRVKQRYVCLAHQTVSIFTSVT